MAWPLLLQLLHPAIARRADIDLTTSISVHTDMDAMRTALDKTGWEDR